MGGVCLLKVDGKGKLFRGVGGGCRGWGTGGRAGGRRVVVYNFFVGRNAHQALLITAKSKAVMKGSGHGQQNKKKGMQQHLQQSSVQVLVSGSSCFGCVKNRTICPFVTLFSVL